MILTRIAGRSYGDFLVDVGIVGSQQQEIALLGTQLDRGTVNVLKLERDIERRTCLCVAGRDLYLDDKELILIHAVDWRLCLGWCDRHRLRPRSDSR